eukprot:746943-Hanusia_phi.AAC.5
MTGGTSGRSVCSGLPGLGECTLPASERPLNGGNGYPWTLPMRQHPQPEALPPWLPCKHYQIWVGGAASRGRMDRGWDERGGGGVGYPGGRCIADP